MSRERESTIFCEDRRLSSTMKGNEDSFIDSILLDDIVYPVVTSNGSIYEENSICSWLEHNNRDVILQEKLVNKELIKITLDDCKYIGKNNMRKLVKDFWKEYYNDKYFELSSTKGDFYDNNSKLHKDKSYLLFNFSDHNLDYNIFSNCTFTDCYFGDLKNIIFRDCKFYGGKTATTIIKECHFMYCSYGKIKDPYRFSIAIKGNGILTNCSFTVKNNNSKIIFKSNSVEIDSSAIYLSQLSIQSRGYVNDCKNNYEFYKHKILYSIENNLEEYFISLINEELIDQNILSLIKLGNVEVEFLNKILHKSKEVFDKIIDMGIKPISGHDKYNDIFNHRESTLLNCVVKNHHDLTLKLISNGQGVVDIAYSLLSLLGREKYKEINDILLIIEKEILISIDNIFKKISLEYLEQEHSILFFM